MIGKKFIFRLFCLLSIALIYEFSFIVFALNVPKWDDFALIHTISEFNASSSWFSKIQLLFKQHNEHRIFFTRVLSLLDYFIFGELNFVHLMFLGGLGIYGILGLLAFTIRYSTQKYGVFILISLFWLSFAFYENTFWGMASIQNFWIITWVLSALFMIVFRPKNTISPFIFSILAIYTSGNGLLILPIIAWFYLENKLYRQLRIWMIFAGGVISLYFFDYVSPPSIAAYPMEIIEFIKAIFIMAGSMIEGLPNHSALDTQMMVFGILLFLGSCFIIITHLVKSWVQKQVLTPMENFIFLGLLFTILTVIMVSYSRVQVSGSFSLSLSRYKVYSTLLISFLLLFISIKTTIFESAKKYFSLSLLGVFWYSSIQHYFLKNIIDQRRFLNSTSFNWANVTNPEKDRPLPKIYHQPKLFLDPYKNYRTSIPAKKAILFNDEFFFSIVGKQSENQNLLDDGIYLILVNSYHCYAFPFIQPRKHSYRNLYNYSSFFLDQADLLLRFKEAEILPGKYRIQVMNGQKMVNYRNEVLEVPAIPIKSVPKNW